MGTIIDYLKEYGDYTFTEKPMNEVDSLILSQFSYLKFDGIVPEIGKDEASVTMEYLDQHQDKERLFSDERYREPNMALFDGMKKSIRYSTLRMNYYVNIIDIERETQFSAITFILQDKTVYIAYRGTDETIIGWKEDFNLAFSKPVPGQIHSVEYLNEAASRFGKKFYMGGHSKGGNFAVYAAMNCKKDIQERLIKIYSHDGPGFRPEVRENGHFERIADRVVKIIPHSSVVGMLLESHADGYIVVESKSFGLLQHDPYTWRVKGDRFVLAGEIYRGRKLMDEALNEWILSLDEEHIHSFVDALYEIVSASNAKTLIDFTADWKKNTTAIINAWKEMDEETVSNIKKIVGLLFEITGMRVKEELQERAEEGRMKLEEGKMRLEEERLRKEVQKAERKYRREEEGQKTERKYRREKKVQGEKGKKSRGRREGQGTESDEAGKAGS